MKATIILADAVQDNRDGTFSLLRGGIDRVRAEKPPFLLRLGLAIRIAAEFGDEGEHAFDLRCIDVDGREVLPTISGSFTVPTVPRGGTAVCMAFKIDGSLPKANEISFVLRVDNVRLDSWNLTLEQLKG